MNDIIAYVLLQINFDGLNLLGDFGQLGDLDYIVKYFSLAFHYDSITKGVIVSEDIIYFFSVILLFLSLAITVIKTLKR